MDFNESARPSSITHPILAENSRSSILINSRITDNAILVLVSQAPTLALLLSRMLYLRLHRPSVEELSSCLMEKYLPDRPKAETRPSHRVRVLPLQGHLGLKLRPSRRVPFW